MFNFTDLTLDREGQREPYAFEDELSDPQHQADLDNLWIDNADIAAADDADEIATSQDAALQPVKIVNA